MNKFYITSRRNPVVNEILDIRSDPSESAFILQGEKFIADTDPKNILKLFVTDEADDGKIAEKLSPDVKIYNVTKDVMEKISGTVSPSSMLAVVKKKNPPMPSRLVLLDCVQDPGNVGTVVRTARAFGYGVICGGGANPLSEKAVRSSAGACLTAYVSKEPMIAAVEELIRQGYTVYGTALDAEAESLESISSEVPEKAAFIIGSEGKGMSPHLFSLCHKTIYIPIKGVESLNAAVAAAIVMYRTSL